jgi:hypothetical protein
MTLRQIDIDVPDPWNCLSGEPHAKMKEAGLRE